MEIKRGGKRKGSGRKSNAEKLLRAKFVADWFSQSFQEIKWKELCNSEDEGVAVRAMSYLTDRVYGKASQPVDVEGEFTLVIDI